MQWLQDGCILRAVVAVALTVETPTTPTVSHLSEVETLQQVWEFEK